MDQNIQKKENFFKIGCISLFVLGIVNFIFMLAGFQEIFGVFIGALLAVLTSQIPFVGTIMAVIGAHTVFGWGLIQSIIVLVIVPIIAIVLIGKNL